MQKNVFVGNLARHVLITGTGENSVANFTLISNEYAGKDKDTGQNLERTVAIQFSAFRTKAEAIAKNVLKGDQLIVDYRLENNSYEKDGETIYGYNFIVENFAFGAPGKEKRSQFSQTSS